MRGGGRVAIGFGVVLGVALILCAALGGAFAAAPAASAESLGAPPGFRLKASNGFSVHAIAFDDRGAGRHDTLLLLVARKHSVVFYVIHATVTESSITADLGAVGSIDVQFVPSGEVRAERTACKEKPAKFDAGFYEGTIDVDGEQGFMHAHATRARGEIRVLGRLVCSGGVRSEGVGGHSPGAFLTIHGKVGGSKVEFAARKNSPTRVSRFEASIEERRGALSIFRGVSATGSANAFPFDTAAKAATVRPPAPFSGKAVYDGAGGPSRRLHGNLEVDFPGRSNVPLIGPATRAGMVRGVQNPGHPFRLR
jgi:predicted DNA-binding protein with PD1-like motif